MTTADLLMGTTWVTDGGLETDLIFHRGIDLPEFASFPLVEDDDGAAALKQYFLEYTEIASAAGAGILLETPTWRANGGWGAVLGYDARSLDRINQASVDLVRESIASSGLRRTLVSGAIGPRGDGYLARDTDADEAADYHHAQVRSFAAAGADLVHAMTMTGAAEAIGVVRAGRAEGLPVAISFTVETDGRLPDGTTLAEALATVEKNAAADWYGVNCAHPTHLIPALEDTIDSPLTFYRPNASTMSHAELDQMTELDTGDVTQLANATTHVRGLMPSIAVLGGCCGTDSRHVAALWGVDAREIRRPG
ncbi:homocysteine S-methyltransferase family protein [soil metagenome]